MQRRGTVSKINPQRAMVAILTDDDGYTIIELVSDSKIEVGDVMTWENGYGEGPEVYENLTKGTREDVYVQNHSVNQSNLRHQLLP